MAAPHHASDRRLDLPAFRNAPHAGVTRKLLEDAICALHGVQHDRFLALETGRERDGAALIAVEARSATAGATLERVIADLQLKVLELSARVRELEAGAFAAE